MTLLEVLQVVLVAGLSMLHDVLSMVPLLLDRLTEQVLVMPVLLVVVEHVTKEVLPLTVLTDVSLPQLLTVALSTTPMSPFEDCTSKQVAVDAAAVLSMGETFNDDAASSDGFTLGIITILCVACATDVVFGAANRNANVVADE